jgi:hypothetical protein
MRQAALGDSGARAYAGLDFGLLRSSLGGTHVVARREGESVLVAFLHVPRLR